MRTKESQGVSPLKSRNFATKSAREAALIEAEQNLQKIWANEAAARTDAKTTIALTKLDNDKSIANTKTLKNVALVGAAGLALALIVKFSK